MSQPSSVLHVNVPLSDLAVAYRQDMKQFLWDTLLPIKVTDKRSNLIRGVNKANQLRRHEMRVGNRGDSVPRVRFKMDANQSYNCTDIAVEVMNDNREEAEADDIVQYVPENLYHLTQALQIGMEYYVIKDVLRNSSIITNYEDLSGTSRQYDNKGSPDSDPIPHWRQICTKIALATGGQKVKKIVLARLTWQKIQENLNSLALGRLESYDSAYPLERNIENLIGAEPGAITISDATYNKATEDDGTPAYRTFIGPDVLFLHTEPPATRSYGLGCVFAFAGGSTGQISQMPDGMRAPFAVMSFPDFGQETLTGGTKMRIVGGVDANILNTDAGYLIKNAVNGSDTASYSDWLKD